MNPNPECVVIAERVIHPKDTSCGKICNHYIDKIVSPGYQYANQSRNVRPISNKLTNFHKHVRQREGMPYSRNSR